MKTLKLIPLVAILLLASCASERCYPVTPVAKKSEKAQQAKIKHQFPK